MNSVAKMVVPPDNIVSLLTAGAIKSMVTGNANVLESSPSRGKTNSSSSKAFFTVLTYPCALMSITGTNNLFETSSNDFYVYDGEHYVRVQILDNNSLDTSSAHFGSKSCTYRDCMETNCVLIKVKSYVTSLVNLNQDDPILCLTGIDICEHELIKAYTIPSHMNKQASPPGRPFHSGRGRILGGKFVDFLTNIAPYMSYEALSGFHEKARPVVSADNEYKRRIITDSDACGTT